MPEIIHTNHLSKHFTGVQAVDDLSFSVQSGEVYGFVGQNGAGKSTTIRMLLTLIRPSGGTINLFGKDIRAHRNEILRRTGAMIEKPDLYKYLTALQNISIMAKLSGINPGRKQLIQQLDRVGIGERADSKVKTFSQGMKQRLGIACALVHEPELLILDEPTNGLDPQGIADIRNLVLHLSKNEGKTIFVSSHLLNEMELIADSMLMIDRGRKLAEGKVDTILNPADTLVEVDTTDNESTKVILRQSQWSQGLQSSEKIVLKMHRKDIPALTRFLVDNKIDVLAIRPKHSLEDYFLSLTTANQHVAAYKN